MSSTASVASPSVASEAFLARCEEAAAEGWREIHSGAFWSGLRARGLERTTYVELMAQIFHYTRHNAQNQALAATTVGSERLPLLRFCLRHALEEAGHDLMVLHDLESIGVDPDVVRRSRPLPETQAFVGWLQRACVERDATARLGYSFWAESCYGYIEELLAAMRRDLSLANGQMTFFVAHSDVDREHFAEVRRVIAQTCDSEELRADLLDVLRTSLALTGGILAGVHRAVAGRTPA